MHDREHTEVATGATRNRQARGNRQARSIQGNMGVILPDGRPTPCGMLRAKESNKKFVPRKEGCRRARHGAIGSIPNPIRPKTETASVLSGRNCAKSIEFGRFQAKFERKWPNWDCDSTRRPDVGD